MPRRLTPFVPGGYYHIYNRGNNRQTIFFEQGNYLYFLRGIKRYLVPVADILAYCLMPTHYHLLVRVKESATETSSETRETSEVFKTSDVSGSDSVAAVSLAVSRAMQRLGISYTKAINKRFGRVGPLFQGAFQAKAITTDAHLRHLCVYIHANPAKDGWVVDPEEWPYSNYPEWVGLRAGQLVHRDFVRAMYGEMPAPSHRQAVLHYLRTLDLPEDIRHDLRGME